MTVVLLFIVSSFIGVIYTQDGDQQEPKLVCLTDNDPYVLNVPKLLNISLNGKMEVVHSNADKFTGIRESCNGIAPTDLETFQLNIEKKFKDISAEIEDVKEILKDNRCNVSTDIMDKYKNTIVKEFKNTIEVINTTISSIIEIVSDNALKEITDAIREIRENVSAEITAIKKDTSGINVLEEVQLQIMENYKQTIVKEFEAAIKLFRNIVSSELANITSTSIRYIPKSCKEVYKMGNFITGVYKIQPKSMTKPFDVLCDLETKGGGWTVIQNRFDGSQDFDLTWKEYKDGFGDINKEFWIGLENIYQMTRNEKNELLVEVVDRFGKQFYIEYAEFRIGPENTRYNLTTARRNKRYSDDFQDCLYFHVGKKFTTKDSDRFIEHIRGGWWLKESPDSNLNGLYLQAGTYNASGIYWYSYSGYYSLIKTRMLIRSPV